MRDLRDYAVITGTYWVFTLSDGALRMLVLLHLHRLGYSPLGIASLFLSYELFGVVTNLFGGWLGARVGLKSTLTAGLSLQIAACGLLAAAANDLTVPLILLAQALSGTAKDLTKMSSKSYIKLVVPEDDQRGLMRWVAVLTGSKNTLKGVGFFLGGFLLATLGFRGACAAMAVTLVVALVVPSLCLPKAPGKASVKVRLRHLVSRDPRINWLSAARLFLFGSRDIWFVLALPVFLSSSLGWEHAEIGAFLALWIIGYGIVQAAAPAFLGKPAQDASGSAQPDARRLPWWTAALVAPLALIPIALAAGLATTPSLILGLALFGFLFAANSALHSYLIVAFAQRDQIALNVGFYYMANAAGRLVGTLLSGALFQAAGQGRAGLSACLFGSIVFVVLSALLALRLARETKSSPRFSV